MHDIPATARRAGYDYAQEHPGQTRAEAVKHAASYSAEQVPPNALDARKFRRLLAAAWYNGWLEQRDEL